MSVIASNWARVQKLHRTPKTILCYLAERANGKRGFFCFPGQKTIAVEAGVSERTVRYALSYLEEMGFIEREQRRRKSGYRSSDTITVMVSDESPEIEPYGDWYRRKASAYKGSHRQLMQGSPAADAISPAGAAGLIEPEGRTGSREPEVLDARAPSSSAQVSSSSSSTDDARDARVDYARNFNDRVKTTIAQEMTAGVPGLSDEEFWKLWTQATYQDELGTPGDSEELLRANQELVIAINQEASRRFGVSSEEGH
jgi:DNA-binding transcriptional ArsR family regulator